MKGVQLGPASTIPDVLKERAARHPDAVALDNSHGEVLSYGALQAEVTRLSAELGSAVEASGRPRIGIVMPNGADIAVVMLAAATMGVAIPFNPRHTSTEYLQKFAALRLDALVLAERGSAAAVEAARTTRVPLIRLGSNRTIASSAGKLTTVAREASPDDIAVVLQTSGSTGMPKLVPLSHRNLCRSARDVAGSVDLSQDDICLAMWEQFHIGGVTDLLLAPLVSGGRIIAAGSFDARRCLTLLATCAPTWFQAVPTTLNELVLVAKRDGIAGSRHALRFVRSVAAALSPELQREIETHFGVPVIRTLGMSEAAPLITTTRLPPERDKPGSVGRSAGPEVAVLSDAGAPVPAGVAGQVAIRGENVFRGYEGDPEATAEAFLGNWFLTGDMGFLDADGDLFLTGRVKDMINRGGEKISPAEVDAALLAHSSVKEAAAFATDHARLGEDIAAAIVVGDSITDAELRAFLAGRLAPHKIPRSFIRLNDLPKTPVGKIDRPALAARFSANSKGRPEVDDQCSDMLRLVIGIWKMELGLDTLGPDEDFTSVDGDSLSAARILFALERSLGTKLPDEVMEHITTAREMSHFLEGRGFRADGEAAMPERDVSRDAEGLAYSEGRIFSGDKDEALSLIRDVASLNDLRLVLDYLVSHLAPHAISPLLEVIQGATLQWDRVTGGTGLIESARMRLHLKAWLKETVKYSGLGQSLKNWRCEIVLPGAILFSDPERAPGTKTLIVGFSGNRMRLLMPAYRLLSALPPDRTDLLLLMDHRKQTFLDGIKGRGMNFEDVVDFVAEFGAVRGYRNLVGLGTSGGSLAAVAAGYSVPLSRTVSVAPMPVGKHPRWKEHLHTVCRVPANDEIEMRVVYGRRSNDREAAVQLQELFPTVQVEEYPHGRKNVLFTAETRGELPILLSRWLGV